MTAYYNENDRGAAAWLRELIKQDLIAPGEVDERSICDVQPNDLEGFTQCHFFAGIGGWSLALRLACWADNRAVWTGSCPCQPFSLSGAFKGTEDHRDLWPIFARLIVESKPRVIFGEQVADAIRWGWLDRAADDLEAADYAIGAAVLPATAVAGIHRRNRLFWAAHPNAEGQYGQPHDRVGEGGTWRASLQSGGLPSVSLAGRWWAASKGAERMPTLVRQFNGLSRILGGFGNAIVPELAAEFIRAAGESC